MKKIFAFLLSACMLLSLAGCALPGGAASLSGPAEAVFTVDNYALQITADTTFQEKTAGSWDLQITNGSAYVSVMAYGYIDLPEGVTTQEVYATQNADLFGKRDAVTVIEEEQTQTLPNGTLTKALYSAEQDGVKNYYACYLIDLPEAETFAWVLITATPSYLENNGDYLHNIVCSLTTVE